jgi:hypothetical protein
MTALAPSRLIRSLASGTLASLTIVACSPGPLSGDANDPAANISAIVWTAPGAAVTSSAATTDTIRVLVGVRVHVAVEARTRSGLLAQVSYQLTVSDSAVFRPLSNTGCAEGNCDFKAERDGIAVITARTVGGLTITGAPVQSTRPVRATFPLQQLRY